MPKHSVAVTHKDLTLMVEGMQRAYVVRNDERIFSQTTYTLLDEIVFTAIDSPKAALFTISHIQTVPSFIILSIKLERWGSPQDQWTNHGICCK